MSEALLRVGVTMSVSKVGASRCGAQVYIGVLALQRHEKQVLTHMTPSHDQAVMDIPRLQAALLVALMISTEPRISLGKAVAGLEELAF
jgi:hypothetical protein